MERLADVDGIEWIRLQYAYPSGFPMDVIDVMSKRDNICNYLDMPLQHGASEMLKIMRRGIDRDKTERLINDIRNKIPDIALRTTLISGHPGETIKEHEEQLAFVERMQFDRLGVFTYSHEENTHSFSMDDNVPEEEKVRRMEEIMEVQQDISYSLNQDKLGKVYKVLIDRKEGGFFIGRTQYDSPEVDNEVLIEAKDIYLPKGEFCNVKISEADAYDLYGSII